MSQLMEAFKECYVVHYSLSDKEEIQVHKAYSLIEVTNDFGGTFLGAKGSSRYGIRFTESATHIGLFDLSDTEKPVLITSFVYDNLQPHTTNLAKARNNFIILRRGLRNYKFVISAYPDRKKQRNALSSAAKKTPQTIKAQNSLKNFNTKKAH